MPAFIWIGALASNTPQQNSGVFIGMNTAGNWDANMKFNTAQGGNFGILSTNLTGGSLMIDNLEFIDGMVNANDMKVSPSMQF